MADRDYAVGIDLGTSNSAIAYRHGSGEERFVDIPQIEAPGRVANHRLLPSLLYLPHSGEVEPIDTRLPWESQGAVDRVAGSWAKDRGAEVPDRLVASAKSWLCNPLIDRTAAILPWKSQIPAGKISPIDASAQYLQHLRNAFFWELKEAGKDASPEQCEFVLTVPASFDEIARNLTVEAATRAGLTRVTLLEEPQAAFYAWLAHAPNWREQVSAGDIVLVCDVGGGTTDFSLVAITEQNGELALERISVGDHLLLGGDNMDLTLAYTLKATIESRGTQLDHWQFLSLVAACRTAKERILADGGPEELQVSIASRGSSLFAQTLSETLARPVIERIILDGFFPLTRLEDEPAQRRGVGIQELGLGYETEPAVSKHLARFLRRSRLNVESDPRLRELVGDLGPGNHLMPTAVLFNGGVFQATKLRERIVRLLGEWSGRDVKELTGARLDLAVAAGAAQYARQRLTGEGYRIRAGTARSYYIGLESPMPAVPGLRPPVHGLCLVPQGTEEGTDIQLPEQRFGLVVGEPVEFRLFSSAVRAGDATGHVVQDAERELEETGRVSVTLPPGDGARAGEVIPVQLDAQVTEIGTLQLFMKHTDSDRKWSLEFNVRPNEHH